MNATEAAIEEQFTVGEECELRVSNISGRIFVRAGEPGTIIMRAVKRGRESRVENTHIETTQEGNRVIIRTRGTDDGFLGINRGVCSVDYDISVPRGCQVETKAVSADISILETGGPVRVDTVSGDAELEDVSGSCTIHTVSGDTRAIRVRGTLNARTTSGDIMMRDSSVTSLNMHTVSGDITLESALTSGAQYYAKSVSGDLVLIVPGDTGATIQLRTVSGRVNSQFPANAIEVINPGRRQWQGRINDGGAQVEMQSVSGNLNIRTSSPVPERHSRSSEERDAAVNEALTALERGEISVEEAMARIKGQG